MKKEFPSKKKNTLHFLHFDFLLWLGRWKSSINIKLNTTNLNKLISTIIFINNFICKGNFLANFQSNIFIIQLWREELKNKYFPKHHIFFLFLYFLETRSHYVVQPPQHYKNIYDHIWHDCDLKDSFTEKLALEAENLLEIF